MTIFDGIDTKGWDDKHLRTACDWLYGDFERYARALELMDKVGVRKDTVRFDVEPSDGESDDN